MSDERMTPQQAATHLGISVEAVRMRIRRGTIESERDDDGHVYVRLDATKHRTDANRTDISNLLVERADLQIEDMREEISYLREELTAERNANAENRRIIARLTESLPQLEAGTPPDAPESPPHDGDTSGRGTTPDERQRGTQRRSIWRRLFGEPQ
jgi:hypothetical protein